MEIWHTLWRIQLMLIWCKSELDWLQNIYLTWKNGEKILGGLEWQAASYSQYMAAFVQMHVSPQSASKDASCQSSCNCLEPDPMCVRRCIRRYIYVPIVAFIWLRLAECILFLVFERDSWVLSNSQQVVCKQSESWLPEQLVEAPHPNGRNLQKVRCQVLFQWFAQSKGDTSWCTKSRIISNHQPDKWDVRWC